MIAPIYTMTVDDRNLLLHIDALPLALRTRLRTTITSLTNELLTRVLAVEPRRTGRLKSLTRSFVDEKEDNIRGRVKVLGGGQAHNIAAAALEYGAHSSVSVKASQRDRSIAVRAYERQANIAARRFLRNPAAEMRERAMGELQKAVHDAVDDANREDFVQS